MAYTNLDKAMDDILVLQHEVIRATRKLIDQIDDDATSNWSARLKRERYDALINVQSKMHDPCVIIKRHRDQSIEAQRLAELREDPDVQAYLQVVEDDRVQEYIRLTKETS